MNEINFEKLKNHLKATGFIFPGSEIYGGLSNTWDYGPLGVILKQKLKNYWWKVFVSKNKYNVGLDSSILLNKEVWTASGHINNFYDPLIDCKNCKSRFRPDKLINEFDLVNKTITNISNWSNEQFDQFLEKNNIKCPKCQKQNFTKVRQFQPMFSTHQGVIPDDKNLIYLRPETAQGIFINFYHIWKTLRLKLPFGVGQIGKAFRNEITPGNYIFRTREFEQMELEFFYDPTDQTNWFDYWLETILKFLKNLGINSENIVLNTQDEKMLAHYAKKTIDIEYKFPFGQEELWGISNRTNYDLTQHNSYLKKEILYYQKEQTKIIPYVIEPSVGVERLLLAILCDSYKIETIDTSKTREVLKLPNFLCPYYLAITPYSTKLNSLAENIYEQLLPDFDITIDLTSNKIGKKYYRQDSIGTKYCITIDFDSETDQKVTIRDRDSREQERIAITNLKQYLFEKYNINSQTKVE